MNTESLNDWTLRPMPFTQWCVLLALLSLTVSSTPSFSQGTLEQRLACTPDVLRLCSAFIPNVDEITTCLRERNAELSDACRTVFEENEPTPAVGDGAGFATAPLRDSDAVHRMQFVLRTTWRRTTPPSARRVRGRWIGLLTIFHLEALCRIECYPKWMVVSGFVGSIAPTNPFELAIAWP